MTLHYVSYSLGEEAALMLVDGPAALPAVPLHESTWYALFYFLRETGTLQGSIEQFTSLVRSAKTPEAQLHMLNRFQPAVDRLSQEEWDTAVYNVLDRAAVVTRLMRSQERQQQVLIMSPVTLLQSADELGQTFDKATRAMCRSTMQHIKLGRSHTECLLHEDGQQEVVRYLGKTIRDLLKLA